MKLLLLAPLALMAGSAFGQAAAAAGGSTSGPIKLGGVTVTGSLRSRLYGWDWFQPTAGDNSYLFGASFLIFCDLIARTVVAPIEMPVGIVTAIIGGPFFLWLLFRGR